MYRSGVVKTRQDPLCARYRVEAHDAWITDAAQTAYRRGNDPFHGAVYAGGENAGGMRFGIHRALGGDHDLPNPGNILCASLAACLDATLRMIADRLGIALDFLEVKVTGDVDVRGALRVGASVPVGFQHMTCRVTIDPTDGTSAARLATLLAAAEHCCVVLNTLRDGVTVDTEIESNTVHVMGA